jgi:hypothetical protein
MTAFDGLRESWEQPPPRSPLLLARDVVRLALVVVWALVTGAWLWAVL